MQNNHLIKLIKKGPDNRGLFESEMLSEQLRSLWCTIADVKITLPDDPEADVKEIRELLDDSANKKEAPG